MTCLTHWNLLVTGFALRLSERFYRAHIDEHEEPKPRRREYPEYGRHLWAPDRCTLVYVDTIPFGLTVIEMTESVLMRYVNGKYIRESDYKPPKTSRGYADHTWTTTEDLPCGRLRITLSLSGISGGIELSVLREQTTHVNAIHTKNVMAKNMCGLRPV